MRRHAFQRHKVTLRKALASVTLLLLSSSTFAQVGEARKDFAVGVSGGYVLDKIAFEPTIRQAWKPGMTLGFTARYTCEKYFSCICALQAEVNYTQMGWKEDIEYIPQSGVPDTYERTLNYVQIPLLARLGFGREQRGVQGYLVLGPQIGFFLGDREKRSGEWSDNTLSHRPNHITQQYDLPIQNKFEYGITGGLGVEVSTKIGHFMAEGRYYFGLSDIFKNGKSDAFGRSAHGAIVAKISYLFDIVKTKGVTRK